MKPLSIIVFLVCQIFNVNGQVYLHLDDAEWKGVGSFNVKGRQGILLKQKLVFADYYTTAVERSWTKSRSGSVSNPFAKMISNEYIERNQTLFFSFSDSSGRRADVHCANDFRANNVSIGNTGVNLLSLFGSSAKAGADLFYAQIFTKHGEMPWHLMIDNEAAQTAPKTYTTRLARSKEEYYTIRPYRLVKNNKGKVTEMTFGFAGYEFRNAKGEALAAVLLINKGIVYLKNLPEQERFLLAAACAAMLLQEQVGAE